jgi:hypothetical protein
MVSHARCNKANGTVNFFTGKAPMFKPYFSEWLVSQYLSWRFPALCVIGGCLWLLVR